METHDQAYFGGPRHGQRETVTNAALDAAQEVRFECAELLWPGQSYQMRYGKTIYRLDPSLEPAGALAYVYERTEWES